MRVLLHRIPVFLIALVFIVILLIHSEQEYLQNNSGDHSSAKQLEAPPVVPNSHDFRICMESNNVLNRDDSIGLATKTSRLFSLRPQDFVSQHTLECSSVQDFLNAVKLGVRRRDDQVEAKNLSWADKEKESPPLLFHMDAIFPPYHQRECLPLWTDSRT
jgi:hypothetical protein